MTMDERIEAAARTTGWYDALNEREKADARSRIGVMFAAAFPELSGDKPGWIAPWEATDGMYEAALEFSLRRMDEFGVDGLSPWKDYPPIRGTTTGMFAAMRDAYLGKGDGG